jgi:hypothetical protein
MRKIYEFAASPGTTEYYREWRKVNRATINARARKRYAANPEKHRERAREYRKTDAYETQRQRKYAQHKASGKAHAWSRAHYLKRAFGLTVADYDAMLAAQNGACAICQSADPKVDKFRYFCVDHCHTTNKVRGLLCNSCNTAIGHLDDNPDRMLRAANYILSHRS